MTRVLEIRDLYKLIPEAAVLENTNFANLKQLITAVIEKVEESGKWQFVQYIAGSPSLYVIREKEIKQTYAPGYDSFRSNEEINGHYSAKSEPTPVKTEKKVSETKKKLEKVEEIEEQTQVSQPSTVFTETKMPW